MRIHFIAIGGAAMHNLALALHQKGYTITGSDDEIAEPSLSRLRQAGLLPEQNGWYPEKITKELDAVILGMHARADNPELLRAQELNIRIYSYPEYLYEFSKNKKRVVIGGSHGKTTITSMIMHVLKEVVSSKSKVVSQKETYDFRFASFDYMVGAKVQGFDTMVKLTEESPMIILEGDEYLSSPIDRRPKFHLYQANIALVSGIAWDHINVFPEYEDYFRQFQIFIDQVPENGVLVYNGDDQEVERAVNLTRSKCRKISYSVPKHIIRNGITFLIDEDREIPLKVFGTHNLSNIEGSRIICGLLGVDSTEFYNAIQSFTGAARRLEFLGGNESLSVFKDFAHSPSKLKATIEAVKNQFKDRKTIACMELHTFSSLNEKFLAEYAGSMEAADEAIVYFNPHTIEHKKLPPVTAEQVKEAFGRNDLSVFTDSLRLKEALMNRKYDGHVLLMMTSGTFDGLKLEELVNAQPLSSLS